MNTKHLCPELHYRKIKDGLQLTGCYGQDGDIYLPDEIEGVPIVAIAPYTFSSNEQEKDDDLVWLSENASFMQERRRLERSEITEIHLPKYVKEVGRYAFYRCWNMHTLTLYNGISEIGGGALNGCRHIHNVSVHFSPANTTTDSPERSALTSIMAECRNEIRVKFFVEDMNGNEENSYEIIFPEHYEEAVENTPARQLSTAHHGSGGYYRQCFYKRALDFEKYDAQFPRASAIDFPDAMIRLTLVRLCYPYKLSDNAKMMYHEYLTGHLDLATRQLLEQNNLAGLRYFSSANLWQKESLEEAINIATTLKKTEALSFLMDERYRLFPKKGKKFLL